jgi:hypothetical protein
LSLLCDDPWLGLDLRGNLDAARMGIAACQHLPAKTRRRYIATILAAVPKRARAILLGEMTVEQRNELWEIERRSGTYLLVWRMAATRASSAAAG